jgi:hypothetical protein
LSTRRAILVWSLVGVATLVLLVSSLTVWTKRQLLDTSNWTNTSSELLANDQIRGALSQELVDKLAQRVDLQGDLQQRLPPNAQAAAGVLSAAIESAAVRIANRLLGTQAVQTLWENANRTMHEKLVGVLENHSDAIKATNGTVTLDLRPIIRRLADRLGIDAQRLKANASPTAGQIVILRSDQIDKVQKAVRVFKALTVFLAFVVLALYALAVYLAKPRRRMVFMGCGYCLAVVGLLILIVRRFGGNYVVDSLVKVDANRPAVQAIWAIGTDLLRDLALGLLLYGLLFVLAAVLAGPSRPATAVRRWLAPTFRQRPWVPYLVAVAVFLMLIAWAPQAGGRRLIGVLVLGALVALGIEIFRRQTLREFPEAEPPAAEPPAPAARAAQ